MLDESSDERETINSPDDGAINIHGDEHPRALTDKIASEVGISPDAAEKAVAMAFMASHRGPVPSPQQLQQYSQVSPDLGTRLAEDYLSQREHDRQCDRQVLQIANKDATRKDGYLSYANRGQFWVSSGLSSLCSLQPGAYGLDTYIWRSLS